MRFPGRNTRAVRIGRTPRFLLGAVLSLSIVAPAAAEEGGSGHYLPGTISSFMDGVSPVPVLITRLNVIAYSGSLGGGRSLPVAGLATFGADVESQALGLTLFWRPSWGRLGERWSYAMSTTIPFVWVDVSADIASDTVGITKRVSDSESGLGDILLTPLMLNYHLSDEININGRLNIFAPSGDYELGRLANPGKNYWTFEPVLGFLYLGAKNGREASLFFGTDFNTENDATNYRSGTQLHIDGTVAQHLPLGPALVGLGATGYWYQQVEGDSGSGARFGDFKARTSGIGPSLSYVQTIWGKKWMAEFKWVHELDVRRRPDGDVFVLKAMVAF